MINEDGTIDLSKAEEYVEPIRRRAIFMTTTGASYDVGYVLEQQSMFGMNVGDISYNDAPIVYFFAPDDKAVEFLYWSDYKYGVMYRHDDGSNSWNRADQIYEVDHENNTDD